MSRDIPINTINPPSSTSDGNLLKGYFFKAEESGLNMYAPAQGNQQPTLVKLNIPLNTAFQVQIQQGNNTINMSVTVTSYTLIVNGTWSDLQVGIEEEPGSGTFQAQAGGGTADDEDIASSATA